MCNVAHPRFIRPTRFSHRSRKSSRHPPPPNRTSIGMSQERGRGEIFSNDDQPSSSVDSSDFVFHFEPAQSLQLNHHATDPPYLSHVLEPSAASDPPYPVLASSSLIGCSRSPEQCHRSDRSSFVHRACPSIGLTLTGFNRMLWIVRLHLRLGRLSPCPDRS